jgi:hypothetical protein
MIMSEAPSYYKGKTLIAENVINDFELNFWRGSAFKYLVRAGKKNNEIEDLRKAIICLQKEIERLES